MTATAFADATGAAPRYAREWLEQQAAAGYPRGREPGVFEHERDASSLPEHHAPVLVDETHPAHVAPVASLFAGVALAFPELVADFRQGRGVAFDEYGAELREGLGSLNRPASSHEMRAWVDTLPDRAAALDAGGAVLDAGCGVGWSTIALATRVPERTHRRARPRRGVDRSRRGATPATRASPTASRSCTATPATRRRSAPRPRREHRDRGATGGIGVEASGFDLVTVFEALHDMGRPVDALAGSGRCCARAARCSSPTSGSPTSSTPTPTRSSECSTR